MTREIMYDHPYAIHELSDLKAFNCGQCEHNARCSLSLSPIKVTGEDVPDVKHIKIRFAEPKGDSSPRLPCVGLPIQSLYIVSDITIGGQSVVAAVKVHPWAKSSECKEGSNHYFSL